MGILEARYRASITIKADPESNIPQERQAASLDMPHRLFKSSRDSYTAAEMDAEEAAQEYGDRFLYAKIEKALILPKQEA